MKTAAIIISAGRSGNPKKIGATLQIGNISVIERMIVTVKKAGISDIYLATNNSELKTEVGKLGATILISDAKEMLSFIKQTLTYIKDDYEQVIIIPDSTALFTSSTIELLVKSEKQVVVPTYNGIGGHPIKIGREVYGAIFAYEGSGGLRDALRQISKPIHRIVVEDRGVIIRETDDASYLDALNLHDLSALRAEVKVRISSEKPFFGPGTKQLLLAVQRTNSLQLACKQSGISYSKGRSMIKNIEEQLRCIVLERQQGGELGGHSKLTQDGKAFLEKYIDYEKLVKDFAEEKFDDFFGD